MKILVFIHSMAGGGAERVTANLTNCWAAAGHEVLLVTSESVDCDVYPVDPSVRRLSLSIRGMASNFLDGLIRTVKRTGRLRRVLRVEQPDVSIGVMTVQNVILAAAGIGLSKTLKIGTEQNFPGRSPIDPSRAWMRSVLYRRLDALVALTSECADWVRENTSARYVCVIPNAVQCPIAATEPKLAPRSQPGRRQLIAVGRLTEQKGFDLLVEAFARVADSQRNWDLVILGDGPDRALLEEKISAAGLMGRVELPGWVGNIADWYETSDLFVMSSRWEGFPCALAEAMAYGLPAISFDCDTGPRDIIRHGQDGLLAIPEDVGSLAQALDRLMSDDGRRATFGVAATEIRERFSVNSIAHQWTLLFSELRGVSAKTYQAAAVKG